VTAALALTCASVRGAEPLAQGTPAPAGCQLQASGTAKVAAALDGRTLALADGRELRLGGIEVPSPEVTAGQAATAALENLTKNAELTLRRLGTAQDRYGRIVAQLFAGSPTREIWIQGELVALGHARVAANVGDRTCALELLRREQAARAAKLGVWSDPVYGMHKAEEPKALAAERGRFAIVEGKVLSVRESGGTIYVNFGRRWSEDFTVTIAKRLQRTFVSAGMEPKQLAGKQVRVRGYVEQRGGPRVEAMSPEQIELVERH
jgi:endonuclease YncB( thermonuclease family)